MKIKLELPLIRSLNEIYASKHWRVRKSDKDIYLQYISLYRSKLTPVKRYPVDIEFNFYFKNRGYDCSNCAYIGKILEDCLVFTSVLKDDTTKFVSSVKYSSLKSDNKTDYVIINIIEGGDLDGRKETKDEGIKTEKRNCSQKDNKSNRKTTKETVSTI